jgi:glycosyltransferase involved in cell wall biosynthesis
MSLEPTLARRAAAAAEATGEKGCGVWSARRAHAVEHVGPPYHPSGASQPAQARTAADQFFAAAPGTRVSVVLPALNEAANLPHVLTRLPGFVHEVVLVDRGSIDDTVTVARALRPDIRVLLQDGRGKGNALSCGFAVATGDIIVRLDADGSHDPAEIPRFVEALLAGHDFAKGSRFAPGGRSADITAVRWLGNRTLSSLVNLLFGTEYSDLRYGYSAFWRRCLPHLSARGAAFEVETLINVRVARAGLQVVEIASIEHRRLSGKSDLRVVRDGLRVLGAIVIERLRRAGTEPASSRLHENPGDQQGRR